MPIGRREFEKGDLEPSTLVLELLRSNPDYAYTLKEIVRELASRGMNLMQERVERILILLEVGGRIESETIQVEVYYIYCSTIGFTRRRRRP